MQGKQLIEATIQRRRAIVYCRVSTDRQERDGESLEYQEEKCRQYAELHNIDVIVVFKEAKSGFVHYSSREQLSLARQFLRDKLADMIIVWDLRRFSRNFVHSAMIFEEIESNGAEIVSVSENVDNTLTGKLIRSILTWSAESEHEKIVEYVNRRWKTRIELGLPVGSGFAPYGWSWADKDKTSYVINKEEAAVRVSIFHMFVELDMSIRGIVHRLSADGIPTATMNRNPDSKHGRYWATATVHDYLNDKANIGILTICKQKNMRTEDGKLKRIPHPDMKEVPGGIPAIIPVVLFERAQHKLAANRERRHRLPRNPEEYLLRGRIYCATCDYKMGSKFHQNYHYYHCRKFGNNYAKCPDMPVILTNTVDKVVWDDCSQLFERIDLIQARIEGEIEHSIASLLEDTTGQQHILNLKAAIDYAQQERSKHLEGSYYYQLITQDIQVKMEQLQRYEEECQSAKKIAAATTSYKERVLDFFDFIHVMKGRYHDATYQEKRNALDVLDVKVYIKTIKRGTGGRHHNGEKSIEITYSRQLPGVNTSLHER